MRRLAGIDAHGDRLFVVSWWATGGNYPIYIQGDWADTISEPLSEVAIGRLVRAALAASRDGVPCPDFRNDPEGKRRRRDLLKLAGVRSETEYMRGTRHATVRWDDPAPEFKVTPHRNGGRREGFEEMLDEVAVLDAGVDDATLGAAVRRALEISTDGT